MRTLFVFAVVCFLAVPIWAKEDYFIHRTYRSQKSLNSAGVLSGDMKYVVVLNGKGEVRSWRYQSGRALKILNTGGHRAKSLAIDPKTSIVYTGGEDRKINIWNIRRGTLIGTFPDHRGPVRALAISSNGKLLISGGNDNEIRIWQTTRRAILMRIKEPTNRVVKLAFHPSNQYFAWINGIGEVKVWDLKKRAVVSAHKKHTGTVRDLAFSYMGSHIASVSVDKTIVYWNWRTNEHTATFAGHQKEVTGVSFHPQGKFMLSCSMDGSIKLWDLKRKRVAVNLSLDDKPVVDCSFSSDGSRVLGVFKKNYLKIWALGDNGHFASLTGHTDSILSLDIARNGRFLASASLDNTVKVWDIGSAGKKLLRDYPVGDFKIRQVRFAPDNVRFATSGTNGEIRIWDRRKEPEDESRFTVLKGHRGAINTVDFHPDRDLLISGGADKYVYLWDIGKRKPKLKTLAHDTQIADIRFSPKGSRYATASLDRTVKIWNLESNRPTQILTSHSRGVRAVAFSDDERKLASASDDKFIALWDAFNGRLLHTMSGHDFIINGIHFLKGGNTLISSSRDKTIRIWHADNGAFIRTLTDEKEQITSMAANNSTGLLAIGGLGPDIALHKLPERYLNLRNEEKTDLSPEEGKNRSEENNAFPLKPEVESVETGWGKVIDTDIKTEEKQEIDDRIFEPVVEEIDRELVSLQSKLNRLLKKGTVCKDAHEIKTTALRIQKKLPRDRAVYYAMIRISIAKMDLYMAYLMDRLAENMLLDRDRYDFATDTEMDDFFDIWKKTLFSRMAAANSDGMQIEFTDCGNTIRQLQLSQYLLDVDIPEEVVKKIQDRQIVIDLELFSDLDRKSGLFQNRLLALIEAVENLPGGKKTIRIGDLKEYLSNNQSSVYGHVVVDLSTSRQWNSNGNQPTFQLKREGGDEEGTRRSLPWRTYRADINKTKRLLIKEGRYYLKFDNQVRRAFSVDQANREIRIVVK